MISPPSTLMKKLVILNLRRKLRESPAEKTSALQEKWEEEWPSQTLKCQAMKIMRPMSLGLWWMIVKQVVLINKSLIFTIEAFAGTPRFTVFLKNYRTIPQRGSLSLIAVFLIKNFMEI